MTIHEWLQRLLELLCDLMKRWGKSCEHLSTDPAERVRQVDAYYRANGPPPVDQHPQTLLVLDALEIHLAEPQDVLDPETLAILYQMIHDLRKDCEPQ